MAELMGIGLFGGTFDPVHIGHLRTAVELRELLGLEAMHMLPCARPAHRGQPVASAEQRLAMLRLGIGGEPGLVADDRELRRSSLSYTIDTLIDVRAQFGAEVPLYLCVGMDSLVYLNTWHRWRELGDFAHLVVVARPGWQFPQHGETARWLAGLGVKDPKSLAQQPCGGVCVEEMTLLPVSSSRVREDLAAGRSLRYLVPDCVIDYIERHVLYRSNHK